MATEAWHASRSWAPPPAPRGRSGQRGKSLFGACLGMDGGKAVAGLNEYFVGRLPCQGFRQRENQRDSLGREVFSELYNVQNRCCCVRGHQCFFLLIFPSFFRPGIPDPPSPTNRVEEDGAPAPCRLAGGRLGK